MISARLLAKNTTRAFGLLQRSLKFQPNRITTNQTLISKDLLKRSMSVVKDDGQFKTWKPVTPGVRGKKIASRKHLWKGKPIKSLTIAKRGTGGRNHTGRITVRHRGGGVKRRIRLVDFHRKDKGPQEVIRIEYDPGRTAHIALIRHLETKKLSYILAPDTLAPGMIVESYMFKIHETPSSGKPERSGNEDSQDANVDELLEQSNLNRSIRIEIGNCLPLRYIPPGTTIHNISLNSGGRAQIARSAGSSAQLLYTANSGKAQVKLASGEVRYVPVNSCATIGTVSNPNHKHENLGKAGVNRLKGWRPTVRGTAMNKHDHPNGGGRGKSKGNRQSTSPWGKLAKGGKTRYKLSPMVIRHRKKK
ncbi:hypothetical protein BB559_002123 [Furculomyces boomerangus]|uniref:Large ribosomal subunit protein uL2m n=2 Tax=Harpellales TaxID=61421 RepID=A0A2T9Y3K1_9FUNG|nr:hypothetical protein BB559_006357 [Furculomyces boomerangus]PVU97183.1 hypothetical protein BB559_002123 [Furculomyces boomerangus]PWA03681.1 hypothetical protein BB558_000183 [Smittium angustum]